MVFLQSKSIYKYNNIILSINRSNTLYLKARCYPMQKICMEIQKGNAAWIISTKPSNIELDWIFYL